MRCHGNKVSTINGVIFSSLSLLFSLRRVTFLPERVIVEFQNFAWGFNSQKKIQGTPPAPGGVDFFVIFWKKLKVLRIA